MLKVCTLCERELRTSEFRKIREDKNWLRGQCRDCGKKNSKQYYSEHRDKMLETSKNWYQEHKEEVKDYERNRRRKHREDVINYYGGKCVCCGESQHEFLAVDHINGGGLKHRREENFQNIVEWILKNNYPPGFRILCHNCNMAIGIYGFCPHEVSAYGT